MGYSLERDEQVLDELPTGSLEMTMLEKGSQSHRYYVPWLVAVAVIGLWWLITAMGWATSTALPSPVRVYHDFITVSTVGYGGTTLLTNIVYSVVRISIGFVVAILVGVPIGFLMATNEYIFSAVDPLLQFLRPIPPLAYIPVMVIWFGIGELSKVILIFFCTIPIIIISAMSGVRNAQENRIRVAHCFGANKGQTFRYVILPSALPEIFTGMRVAIGVAWTCLVAAEMIAAQHGLGAMIQTAGAQIATGVVFVGIVMIGIVGYVMELIIRTIELRLIPWKGKA